MRRPLGSVAGRSLRRHKVFGLGVLRFVRSLRRFSSLDFRLLSPAWFGTPSRVSRNDTVSTASLEDRFLCLEGSDDRLSERTPYISIDRSRKRFWFCNCRGIVERICRMRVWAGSPGVVKKRFAPCTLADPFDVAMEIIWPKSKSKLKSITVIFSYNLLCLLVLQNFTKALTGQ